MDETNQKTIAPAIDKLTTQKLTDVLIIKKTIQIIGRVFLKEACWFLAISIIGTREINIKGEKEIGAQDKKKKLIERKRATSDQFLSFKLFKFLFINN